MSTRVSYPQTAPRCLIEANLALLRVESYETTLWKGRACSTFICFAYKEFPPPLVSPNLAFTKIQPLLVQPFLCFFAGLASAVLGLEKELPVPIVDVSFGGAGVHKAPPLALGVLRFWGGIL